MNSIERLQKLSGIKIIEGQSFSSSKKYDGYDKAGLMNVRKELQAVMAHAARASFKYKNAREELAVVDEKLKELDTVKEGFQLTWNINGKRGEETFTDDQYNEAARAFLEKGWWSNNDKDTGDVLQYLDTYGKVEVDDDYNYLCLEPINESKKDSDEKPPFFEKKDDADDKSDKKSDDTKEDDEKNDTKEKAESKECKCEDEDESVKESTLTADEVAALIMEKDFTPTEVETDYQNGPVENSGIKKEQGTKIRFPPAIKAEVNKRIKELDQAILRYDDKGYDDKSIKQQAVDCLNQIMQDLSTNDIEGVKKAQIYFETLMSPLTDFFPPKLINWLANALNPYVGVKEALSLGDGEYQVSPVEKLPKGEFVKRKPDANKVYIVGEYDPEYKTFSLEDDSDISREIFVKPGTMLVHGFTY